MRKFIKFYHSTLEINDVQTYYYLVITEYCFLTNRVIRTYTVKLPDWVAVDNDPNYEYYQPIFN